MALAARRYVEVEVSSQDAVRALRQIETHSQRAEKHLSSLRAGAELATQVFGYLGGAAGIGYAVKALYDFETASRATSRQLDASVDNLIIANDVYAQLTETSNNYNVQLAALAKGFVRLRNVVPNAETQDLVNVQTTLAQALSTTSATATETASVTHQFGQAMGAGYLRGQELNSILDAAPVLVNAWAQALGRADEGVRAIAESNGFSRESFIELADEIQANIAEMTGLEEAADNVSKAINTFANELDEARRKREQAGGTTLSGAIDEIATAATEAEGVVAGLYNTITNFVTAPFDFGKFIGQLATGTQDFSALTIMLERWRIETELGALEQAEFTERFKEYAGLESDLDEVIARRRELNKALAEATNVYRYTTEEIADAHIKQKELAELELYEKGLLLDLTAIREGLNEVLDESPEKISAITVAFDSQNAALTENISLLNKQADIADAVFASGSNIPTVLEDEIKATEQYTEFLKSLKDIGGQQQVALGAGLDIGDIYLRVKEIAGLVSDLGGGTGNIDEVKARIQATNEAIAELYKDAGTLDQSVLQQLDEQLRELAGQAFKGQKPSDLVDPEAAKQAGVIFAQQFQAGLSEGGAIVVEVAFDVSDTFETASDSEGFKQ